MRLWRVALLLTFSTSLLGAQGLNCNLREYKPIAGVTASANRDSVVIAWPGEKGAQLRARFTLRDGQPVIEELAASKAGGAWVTLGKDLTPEFQVTTGRRRMSTTELDILKNLHTDTPENEERYKWNVFWDVPLAIPGTEDNHLVGPARTQDEVKRATVSYQSSACSVTSDGDRVSVIFNGLTLGLFAGDLEFTAYKGSNLLRQEAVAKTDAANVAERALACPLASLYTFAPRAEIGVMAHAHLPQRMFLS